MSLELVINIFNRFLKCAICLPKRAHPLGAQLENNRPDASSAKIKIGRKRNNKSSDNITIRSIHFQIDLNSKLLTEWPKSFATLIKSPKIEIWIIQRRKKTEQKRRNKCLASIINYNDMFNSFPSEFISESIPGAPMEKVAMRRVSFANNYIQKIKKNG